MLKLKFTWFFLLFTAIFTSCTACNEPPETTEENGARNITPGIPVTSEPDPLAGTRWELTAWESQGETLTIPDKPQVTLRFRDGSVVLRTGCNDPGGHYLLHENNIEIIFSRITGQSCEGENWPPISAIETAFRTALSAPTIWLYELESDTLHIQYLGGEMELRRLPDSSGKFPAQARSSATTLFLWAAVGVSPYRFPQAYLTNACHNVSPTGMGVNRKQPGKA